MSFLKMLSIVIIIFIAATVAWMILGTVTKVRTQDYSWALSNQVSNLCGSRLVQKSPIFTAITQLRQKVPSFEGVTQKTSGFWEKKTKVTRACPILANDLIIREINLHWAC